jgi:hypothetical protein
VLELEATADMEATFLNPLFPLALWVLPKLLQSGPEEPERLQGPPMVLLLLVALVVCLHSLFIKQAVD